MRLLTLSLLAALAALLAPGAASAAVTIGGDMDLEDGSVDIQPCSWTFACTYLLDVSDGEPVRVPDLGTRQEVVTHWRLRAVGTNAKARLRRLAVDGDGAVSRSPGGYWTPIQNTIEVQELEAQLEVEPGEAIAVDISGGSMARDSRPGSSAAADAAYFWSPDLGDYERRLPNDIDFPFVGDLQYQVVIEPDADEDGLGDESQDSCICVTELPRGGGDGQSDQGGGSGGGGTQPSPAPSPVTPAPAALRPALKRVALAKRVTVKGKVAAVSVTNPNAFALKGSLTLKLGKQVAAKGKLAVPAGASRAAKLKLGKRARAALKRRGKLTLKAVAKFRDGAGKPRRASASVTLSRGAAGTPGPGKGKGKGKGGNPTAPTSPTSPAPTGAESTDGTYHGNGGLTMVINGGKVTIFSGELPTYCTKSGKQKIVAYGMFGDDPDPTVGADGSFAYEATTNYGFVKLKYEGRVNGKTASGHLNVEDRSPFSTPEGKLDFDYCYAGGDWTATR